VVLKPDTLICGKTRRGSGGERIQVSAAKRTYCRRQPVHSITEYQWQALETVVPPQMYDAT